MQPTVYVPTLSGVEKCQQYDREELDTLERLPRGLRPRNALTRMSVLRRQIRARAVKINQLAEASLTIIANQPVDMVADVTAYYHDLI